MKPGTRRWITILSALLLTGLIAPFLVPVPALEGTVPPGQLADADSRFLNVNGLEVHYKTAGEGDPTFVLLHGFGASVFSWREVIPPLSAIGRVIAYDRPAFGLTERPLEWDGLDPYSPQAQVELLLGLLDALDVDQAVLVGNSAGGTVALDFALQHPQRVQALILVDAAVYTGGGAPNWLLPALRTPQMMHLGPLLVRSIEARGEEMIDLAWHDPSMVTPEVLEGYRRPLQAENWDRALWLLTTAARRLDLAPQLAGLSLPVLVISGDDDRIVPTEESLRLAREIPGAGLAVLPACGHVPHEECPQAFMAAVLEFLSGLDD